MIKPFCFLVWAWQANNIVVCLPVCPQPTQQPFCFHVWVCQANNIVVCLPTCPCPTLEPFCFLVWVWQANNIVVSLPACTHPTNKPFCYFGSCRYLPLLLLLRSQIYFLLFYTTFCILFQCLQWSGCGCCCYCCFHRAICNR